MIYIVDMHYIHGCGDLDGITTTHTMQSDTDPDHIGIVDVDDDILSDLLQILDCKYPGDVEEFFGFGHYASMEYNRMSRFGTLPSAPIECQIDIYPADNDYR